MRIDASSRCNINGTISGAGTLNYYVPYVRADLVAGGGNNFTGKINVTGRDFRITANTASFPQAAVNLGSDVFMGAYSSIGSSSTNSSTIVKIGSLSGEATSKVGGGTWQIGTDGRDATFNGVFQTGAKVTKLGTGKWTLTNASATADAFTVSDGTLIVRNTTGSATGTGNLSLTNSAVLMGTGAIGGNVTLNYTSRLSPGINETSIGTLSFSKNLTLTQNTTTLIKTNAASNDKLNVTGILNLNGTLEMKNIGATWESGKSYQLFTAGTINGSFTSILPEVPGEGLEWDVSRMNEGIIAVKIGTGVKRIDASRVKIYPQPVKDYCFVSLENEIAGKIRLEIFNANGGKEITYSDTSSDIQIKLDMSGLPAGIYFLRLTNAESAVFTHKLIKL